MRLCSGKRRAGRSPSANKLYKKMLAEYEASALDPAIDGVRQAFMAKEKAAVPDSNV
jgi:trimethylamine---corrinoid protein Co-methyltransferase